MKEQIKHFDSNIVSYIFGTLPEKKVKATFALQAFADACDKKVKYSEIGSVALIFSHMSLSSLRHIMVMYTHLCPF